ncbi:hypothetical protein H5410_032548 [Solanum commersonii]|uniref:Uncharacterized protein n=1 Tax=Solanum commersonii TaxID=4109 RepID=A0A9J5YL94_SOLCO|nr:hypothetical protein H5410_032548 [Solanum commersonii]
MWISKQHSVNMLAYSHLKQINWAHFSINLQLSHCIARTYLQSKKPWGHSISAHFSIEISRVQFDSEDDFRLRGGPELDLAFLGVIFVSCDFREFWVRETLDSCFDGSIESGASSRVKFHI